MPLPVPYIQNYSIEFSRISGYYTKKKPTKRFGPLQISVAETEVSESSGKEQGSKKASLTPRAVSMARARETPLKIGESKKGDLHALSTSRMLKFAFVLLPCLDIYTIPPPQPTLQ